MKPKFKNIFYLILCFLLGGSFYYFMSKTFLKETAFENSGISDLAYEKISLLNEDINKYESRISSSNILSGKIENITREIPGIDYSPNLKGQMERGDTIEINLYHEYILLLEGLFKRYDVNLNEKYYEKYTNYIGIITEDPKVTEMKEFNTDAELSKIFYNIFRVPALNALSQRINKNLLYQNYSEQTFEDRKRDLVRDMSLLKTDLITASKTATRKQKESDDKMKSYTAELKSLKELSINKITLYVALPLFAFILIAVFLIPSQYVNNTVQKLFLEKNIIKDVLTIFLLTSTIILLGLSGVIKGEIIGTLLGGISVYVLQRGLESKPNGDNPKEPNTPLDPNAPLDANAPIDPNAKEDSKATTDADDNSKETEK